MQRAVTAALVVILLPLVGGWIAGSAQPGGGAGAAATAEDEIVRVRVLEDPEGDAVARPYTAVTGYGSPCASAPDALHETCTENLDRVSASATPAPPDYDILAVDFVEGPLNFTVEVELARVDASLAGASSVAEGGSIGIYVCWGEGANSSGCLDYWEGPNFLILGWWVSSEWTGSTASGEYWGYGPSCGAGLTGCEATVTVELVEGTPGRIRGVVPRTYLAADAGDAVGQVFAWTERSEDLSPAGPNPLVVAGGRYIWPGMSYEQPDTASARSDHRIVTPRPTPDDLTYAAWMEDPVGDFYRKGADDLGGDIIGAGILETPEAITLVTRLARLPEDLTEISLQTGFGFQGGPSVSLRWWDVGQTDIVGRLCLPKPDSASDECSFRIPMALEATPGAPGWINLTVSRAYFADLGPGALLTNYWSFVGVFTGSGDDMYDAGVAFVYPVAPHIPQGDGVDRMPAFWLRQAATAAPATETQVVQRFGGDFSARPQAPDLLVQGRTNQFDVFDVQVLAESARGARIAMSIRDLSRETIPEGYDGFAYAVGVRLPDGDRMFGYYRGDGAPTGLFFCGSDSLLFRDTPADPLSSTLTPIEGAVLPTSGGFGTLGSLVTWVPAACLGAEDPVRVEADAIAAGSFLIRNPTHRPGAGIVTTADRIDVDEPVTVYATSAPPAPPALSWFDRAETAGALPFVFGSAGVAAVALVLVAAGAVLMARRRGQATAAPANRLTAYENMLALELDQARPPKELATRLKPVRAALSISDTEHARLEAALRAQRAGALGVARELVPQDRFLDRYEVVLKLGTGGEASTYLCRDERLGREVVLKVLRFAAGGQADQVLREARAFGKVRHENVVMIYDVEQVADEIFLVLEHVEGGTLKDRVGSGPFALADFRVLARDLLGALAAVHAVGIVHRDVKPSNVLVTPAGRFKLADFGIAHVPGYENTLVSAGKDGASGTLPYMSPEQARGHKVDPRSDLYSAAATLLEAWTGRPYIEARDDEGLLELQLRVASGKGSFEHFIGPPELKSWFARALDPDAQGRFASAQGMMGVLDLVLGSVRDASAMERTRGAVRK